MLLLPGPSAPSASVVAIQSPSPDGGFKAGQRIRHQPSGRKGTLVQWDESAGRWKARLKCGCEKMLRSKHLQIVTNCSQVSVREGEQPLAPPQAGCKATFDAQNKRSRHRNGKDVQARQCGQWLYITGWLLLPFFGIGLLLWVLAACQYYSKPARTRKRYPQQSITGCLSLATLVMVVTIVVACIVLNLHPFRILTSELHTLAQESKEGYAAVKDLLHEVGFSQKHKHTAMTSTEDHGGKSGIFAPLVSTNPMPSSFNQFLGKPAHAAGTNNLPGTVFTF